MPPLANAQTSATALASAVLTGFERRDIVTLRALAVNEQEFRDHVWPELPSARPERNLPFSYVWGDLRQKSEAALAGTLASREGQHYELIAVRFLGGTTQYQILPGPPGNRADREGQEWRGSRVAALRLDPGEGRPVQGFQLCR